MKYIEQWGTGIPRIINQSKDYGLAEPLFEEFGNGIRVTMYRKQKNTDKKTAVIQGGTVVIQDGIAVIEGEYAVIREKKAVIEEKNAAIQSAMEQKQFTSNKAEELKRIVLEFPLEEIFEREDIETFLECKKTKAIKILGLLQQLEIIIPVTGSGKGKYTLKFK